MLAGAAFIGLSAAPATASDGVDPLAAEVPAVAGLVEQAVAPLEDAAPLPEPPTHEGESAAGSAVPAQDVASNEDPGGAEAAGNALADVISGAVERDIAPVVAAVSQATDAPADDPVPDPQPDIANTAPASREGQSQSVFDAVEAALRDEDQSEGPAGDAAGTGPRDGAEPDAAPQYQHDSGQYQSGLISDENSWEWDWYLEMDCDGIVSSNSNEKGTSASDDWTWKWNWKWTCGLEGASERASDDLARDAVVVSTDDSTPSAGSTPTGQADGSEPSWLWTWTFTFCGKTTTIVTPVNVDPELRWLWTWTWTWACTEEQDEPDAAADDSAGDEVLPDVPEEGAAEDSERLPWIDEFVRFEELDIPMHDALDALLAPGSVPSFLIPPAAVPPAPHAPRPELRSADAPTESRPARPATPGLEPGAPAAYGTSGSPAVETAAAEPDSRARRHDAREQQRKREPRAPARAPTRGFTGAPPASSGSGTGGSGTGAGGVAALTGYLILAVPGLGRRIREARELSPRAPLRDRLERPG